MRRGRRNAVERVTFWRNLKSRTSLPRVRRRPALGERPIPGIWHVRLPIDMLLDGTWLFGR